MKLTETDLASMDSAKLSIAMATCNGERYVRKQLESFRLQTRPPDELVVSDDCSTDATVAITNEFKSQCSFPIIILQNKQRLGLNKNFEQAIRHCTGDIIALCDQDDYWKPEKLAIQLDELEGNPELDAVFSDAEVVDEQLTPLGKTLFQAINLTNQSYSYVFTGDAFRVLIKGNIAAGMSIVFKAYLREQIFPIPDFWESNHDWWIALMISAIGRMGLIDRPLVYYRQHGANLTGADIGSRRQMPAKKKWVFKLERDRAQVNQYKCFRQMVSTIKLSEQNTRYLYEADDYFDHLDNRVCIRDMNNRRSRLPIALKEFLRLRYYRFTDGIGFKRFIKDICL